MEPTQTTVKDEELLEQLRLEAYQNFSPRSILLLEELFRRYKKCLPLINTNPTTTPNS